MFPRSSHDDDDDDDDCVLHIDSERITKVGPGYGQYQHVGSDGSPRSRL